MPEDNPTLTAAARTYLESLDDKERMASQVEVERFTRWLGADRLLDSIRGQEVANYADVLTGSVTDATNRADVVRAFLAYAKKAGFSQTNLGAHLRLRKGASTKAPRVIDPFEMSEQQKVLLSKELESLKAQRPRIVADIQRAMADKDFRENAPLDAAKQEQGLIEAKIRELEYKLQHAVIVTHERAVAGGAVDIGSTVALKNLKTGAETKYTVVRPGEGSAGQGQISYQSPVGQALLGNRVGDEVEVEAPSGTLRFRIERVEA